MRMRATRSGKATGSSTSDFTDAEHRGDGSMQSQREGSMCTNCEQNFHTKTTYPTARVTAWEMTSAEMTCLILAARLQCAPQRACQCKQVLKARVSPKSGAS